MESLGASACALLGTRNCATCTGLEALIQACSWLWPCSASRQTEDMVPCSHAHLQVASQRQAALCAAVNSTLPDHSARTAVDAHHIAAMGAAQNKPPAPVEFCKLHRAPKD